MTPEEFILIKNWVRAEAKLIAAEVAGHHPDTLAKHRMRVMSAELSAQRVFVKRLF